MKTVLAGVLAVGLMVSSWTPAFALLRRDFTAVEGPVLYKNAQEKKITVRNSNGAEETFIADDGQFASVQEGDTVIILHQIDNPQIGTIAVTQPK